MFGKVILGYFTEKIQTRFVMMVCFVGQICGIILILLMGSGVGVWFAVALFVGIAVGAWSSVAVVPPLLPLMGGKLPQRSATSGVTA